MQKASEQLQGVGLGYRRAMSGEWFDNGAPVDSLDFVEIAPENWIGMGGRYRRQLEQLAADHRLIAHGLSLSIGSRAALDQDLIQSIKQFLDQYQVELYSEHLSYCSDEGHLYDLLPLPFTEETVVHTAARIREVSERLERRLVLENISFYLQPADDLTELEFIQAILQESDCELLLDINNVYVNSVNHGYDALTFIRSLPSERIRYLHVAGHYQEADDLIIDTHGADIARPVWDLLDQTYQHLGATPTLLERDFNIPSLAELWSEVKQLRSMQQQHTSVRSLCTAEVCDVAA